MDGQRILHLRSVFKFTNNTPHDLELLTLTSAGKDGDISQDSNAESYIVKTGQDFHVPLSLMQRCAFSSAGRSLGYLRVRPLSTNSSTGSRDSSSSFPTNGSPLRCVSCLVLFECWRVRG